MKKLKIAGIILVVITAMAFSIPFVFKERILRLAKQEFNKNLDAKIDFRDLGLSLFRHFPDISVKLDDISIVGINGFSNDTLLSAASLDASVNLWSMIRGNNMRVRMYLPILPLHSY